MEIEVFYHCEDGGDGSVSVEFHATKQEADKAEESMSRGWGEPSVGSLKLKLEDDKVFFRDYREVNGKFQWVWIEIPR